MLFNQPPDPIDAKTKVIRLTSPGRAAVASILLEGSSAAKILMKRWIGPELRFESKPVFGRFRLMDHTNLREEVVVHAVSREEIEIHCHGGSAVVEAILTSLTEDGAQQVSWQDDFQAGRDQIRLALKMLPSAPTERTAKILLDQLGGALERELDEIVALDDEAEQIRRQIQLQGNSEIGRHLIEPFFIVLAGATNAGKSSLLNAILGFQRAIADPAPGTTRDTVIAQSALNGFPVMFCDTAGFRNLSGSERQIDLERQGMQRASDLMNRADLIVWVVDSSADQKSGSAVLPPAVSTGSKVLVCFNKTDLPESVVPEGQPGVSAATGQGIDVLMKRMFERLIPDPPKPGQAVPLPQER